MADLKQFPASIELLMMQYMPVSAQYWMMLDGHPRAPMVTRYFAAIELAGEGRIAELAALNERSPLKEEDWWAVAHIIMGNNDRNSFRAVTTLPGYDVPTTCTTANMAIACCSSRLGWAANHLRFAAAYNGADIVRRLYNLIVSAPPLYTSAVDAIPYIGDVQYITAAWYGGDPVDAKLLRELVKDPKESAAFEELLSEPPGVDRMAWRFRHWEVFCGQDSGMDRLWTAVQTLDPIVVATVCGNDPAAWDRALMLAVIWGATELANEWAHETTTDNLKDALGGIMLKARTGPAARRDPMAVIWAALYHGAARPNAKAVKCELSARDRPLQDHVAELLDSLPRSSELREVGHSVAHCPPSTIT